jgi:hypothetical protein
MAALWGLPSVAVIVEAGPGLLVSAKFAGASAPTVAVSVYEPAVELAVNCAAVATPAAFVVAVLTPLAKVPLAPLAGAANVTNAQLTGLLPASLTVTCSGVKKARVTIVL